MSLTEAASAAATPPLERCNDPLSPRGSSLEAIFNPKSVAVIGATDKPGSVGRTILWNLISSPFGGAVFPVNPKRTSVLGIRAYPNVAAVPDSVDLAVIVTPAPTVPGVMAECADKGVRGAIVISAGFKEAGPEGQALEDELRRVTRAAGIRVVGPNCLGVMNPRTGLNATFAAGMARPGNVAFMSQSGALCTAVLDWSLEENVGFSAFASIGSMLDVGWGALIDHLGRDPHTRSIILYMESVGDARAFLSAAREVALSKPIIVIKPGRTSAGAKAAASHTGSLTGSDEVLDAAFGRCGVLRVFSIAEVFDMAEVLGKQPTPKGPHLAILTNAGGPGVLATDELLLQGGKLATLSAETLAALDRALPAHWSHGNPIDVLGDAGPDRYAQALEITAADPASDGLLVILTPQAMTEPTATAEGLRSFAKTTGKPLLASFMGGPDVRAAEAILNRVGIPTFAYPDRGARVFAQMWRYADNLRKLYETPSLPPLAGRPAPRGAGDAIVRAARQVGRSILTEAESKALLAAYDLPTVPTTVARTEAEAEAAAKSFGFPVVAKLHSETITHKTDVGGVKLGLGDAAAVQRAFRDIKASVAERIGPEHFLGITVQPMVARQGYELILGSSIDPQFGPVLLFGAGGTLVEVFQDRALGLPPLTSTLAKEMIQRTRICTALRGIRGQPPVDLAALAHLLVTFGQLVVEQPAIRELDINPLLASPDGFIALDARVVLFDREVPDADLPRPAIRPYPVEYVWNVRTRSGMQVCLRPIRPEDEPLLVRFHETLSERSVYQRYLEHLHLDQRIAHQRLSRLCFIDYGRDTALVAERTEDNGHRTLLGVGRLWREDAETAEFSLLVADAHQGQGLGAQLLDRLIQIARVEGIGRVVADILPGNAPMLALCRKLGFALSGEVTDPTVRAVLKLRGTPPASGGPD